MERYCEQEKNCLRVYVPRELDHHEADRLKQEADFFIETGQVKTLVFDFAGTEVHGQLRNRGDYRRSRKMGYFGGEVYAEHLSGRILKIFKVSGLHTLIRTSVPKQQKEREGENHNA